MTSSFEGAKEARKEIQKFHACLTHKALVPNQFFRRNSLGYPLQSSTSQLIALFTSKNYDVIPVMVSRIATLLESKHLMPMAERYYEIIFDYICQMTYYVQEFTDVDERAIQISIPEEIMKVGSRKAPLFDNQKWEFVN